MDADVWYVAYGSNLSWRRFRCYLEGGRPPGSGREHPPSRDPSRPADERAVVIPHRLYFAGCSASWDGGGVAFVDPEPGTGEALGRAYRVTREQLADIYAGENGMAPGLEVPEGAFVGPVHDLGGGPYRLLVRTADVHGVPAFTVTGPTRRDHAAPALDYLRHVVDGLEECHGMGVEEAVDHLMTCEGVRGRFDGEALTSALDRIDGSAGSS